MDYTHSGNMKLVYFLIHLNSVIYLNGEKIHQGQFSFPPKYPLTDSVIASDSSIYLPPEFHTPTPYFSENNFPFKTLSSANAKVQDAYPTTVPITINSILNYGDERRDVKNDKLSKPSPKSSSSAFVYNQTNKFINLQEAENRKFITVPNTIPYKHPIDRMDTKISPQFSMPTESTKLLNQNLASRIMIISAENGRNQEQKASFHNMHFVSPPNVFLQSTTEPAIPILRLSNEMDLDGSFSYEALGADQTHYVQHSRMENLGSDQEGQRVEGSYSYVGDNGQTYTVHYVADSNGYRATGDHLPVPPPIPEIIQRSIQYNLAEEAKKPPHYKSFDDDESDKSSNIRDKNSKFYLPSQQSLFTGRTPEAFSMGFSQAINSQNNLTPMASSNEPMKAGFEFTEEKVKRNINNGKLEPQITFLASQGAHSPSANVPQKSSLPQLVNYESGMKESEQENGKTLWRWQYGLNSNTDNQNPTKNSISRSFREGDDIIINFSDMTPEQYTNMITNQLAESSQTITNHHLISLPQTKNNYPDEIMNNNNYDDKTNDNMEYSLQSGNMLFNRSDIHSYYNNQTQADDDMRSKEKFAEVYLVQNNPDTFTATAEFPQSYDYENISYESKRTVSIPKERSNENSNPKNEHNSYGTFDPHPELHENYKNNELGASLTSIIQPVSTVIPIENNNKNIQYEDQTEIRPLIYSRNQEENVILQKKEPEPVRSENNFTEVIRNNIFLKNLFKSENDESQKHDFRKEALTEISLNNLVNTFPTPINNESKTYNEIKLNEKKRPLDMSDVLNYMSNKNLFESNRLKIISKPKNNYSFSQKQRINVDSNYDSKSEENKDPSQNHAYNNIRQNIYPQEQELRGIIKNYKVLQRNNIRNPYSKKDSQLQNLSGPQNKNLNYFNLPPLGRAGPSMKSYLPPNYS